MPSLVGWQAIILLMRAREIFDDHRRIQRLGADGAQIEDVSLKAGLSDMYLTPI